nr:malate dehydrogenase [Crypthecodinium cohnii]
MAACLRGSKVALRTPVLRGPSAIAKRHLGETVVGPPITDVKGTLAQAIKFFTKSPVSYTEFKVQCSALRLFAFGSVTAGCALALFFDPPKSSYWRRWSPLYGWSNLWGGQGPLFLSEQVQHEVDVPGLVKQLASPELAGKKVGGSPSGPAASPAPAPAPAPEPEAAPAGGSSSKPTAKKFKVCVCGGAGGIGQPLSLLMALDERVGELSVFDLNISMVPAAGVAADLSHLEYPSKVKAYSLALEDKPIDKLEECLTGCDLVLVPAGMPRKPGMTRADLLGVNAGIAKNIVEACAKFCPDAVVGLIVNPVNSVVPAMGELYKKKGLDPTKIVGVTTLDVVRANKFVSEATDTPVQAVAVPVVGGHAGETILPLFSQVEAMKSYPADKLEQMDKRVQDAGTEVVNAKNGKGSATLSMAYAGARLGKAVLAGLSGEKVEEYAYVGSSITELPYFASKVVFGKKGVEKVLPLPENLSEYEKKRLEALKLQLKGEIEAGLKYAAENSLA